MRITALLISSVILAACADSGPVDSSDGDTSVSVASSPNGASIFVDGISTGLVTPDTVMLAPGDYTIEVRLDTTGGRYGYVQPLQVAGTDEDIHVEVPLLANGFSSWHVAAGMGFLVNATGRLLHELGGRNGLVWPDTSSNTYVTSTMPAVAGMMDGRHVATGPYDQIMLVGRPAQHITQEHGMFRLTQQAWLVPSQTSGRDPHTVRGILIEEEVLADDVVEGVLIVRLTFRNVSNDPLLNALAETIPTGPVTYTDAWLGMMVDADVGRFADNYASYDLDADMVLTYDRDFEEGAFYEGAAATAPALVGLAMLDVPAGTRVLLNSWPRDADWMAGGENEAAGYGILSGSAALEPDHPHARIGWFQSEGADVRMSVTAGPLTLAPGDEAQVVVGIAVAPPTEGTFTSGTMVEPGDPLDQNRPLHAIAEGLRARMTAAAALAEL